MLDTPERRQLDEVFTRHEALEAGVSKRRLYALRGAGEILALGGGVFRWADAAPADLDLIEIAERFPTAMLCLDTALARHGLIDAIPSRIDIAVPRGAHRPRLNAPVHLHYFDRKTFDIGREPLAVGARRALGIYSAERSLVDIVRLRHHEGADLAWEALRRWLRQPGSSPAKLLATAGRLKGAETPLRAALEVLL